MSSNGVGGGAVLDRALAAVGELQTLDLTVLSDDQVLELVSRLEVLRRRLPSVDHALVAELEIRSVAASTCCVAPRTCWRSGCTWTCPRPGPGSGPPQTSAPAPPSAGNRSNRRTPRPRPPRRRG